jgi:1-acyl-sn-glycerol-3-phosphate acyltransferase
LFTGLFFGGLLSWTVFFLVLSPLLWLRQFFSGKRSGTVAARILVHMYGKGCCRLLMALTPFTLRPCPEALPATCIVTPNHQSFFDPYCLGFVPRPNLVFLVRSWPFKIPLYGRIMREIAYLNSDTLDDETFLRDAGKLLRDGVTVIVFPEGTRGPAGGLGRFHAGAFRLSLETGFPIVPLCLNGTGDVFPKGKRLGRRAPVRVSVLPPVDPGPFGRFGDKAPLHLRRHVKAAITQELQVHPTNRFFSLQGSTD